MLNCVKDNEISDIIEGSVNALGLETKGRVKIKGGSCLEVLAGVVRDVPLFNNAGPWALGMKGATVANAEHIYGEVLEELKPGWGKA